jgi:hypothetical protein
MAGECSGRVRLSRLQLPSPGAILANRIDVIEHQASATDDELAAVTRIDAFIRRAAEASRDPVLLIGFNSSRFDLPYLRTTFIRNGFNPYFGGKVAYGDLLHSAKRLAISRADFPRLRNPFAEPVEGEPPRASLSLETLAHALGLLSGRQLHEARADVLLSIELARVFRDRFAFNPLLQRAYEAASFHETARQNAVAIALFPNYDLASDSRVIRTPYALLRGIPYKGCLWIDLDRYQKGEGRRSISWMNGSKDVLFVEELPDETPALLELAARARKEFAEVTLQNFFTASACDIEQDIHRIDFDGIELLRRAIHENGRADLQASKNPDLLQLYLRSRLARYVWGGAYDTEVEERLREYARYRYGGNAPLEKAVTKEMAAAGVPPELRHETLGDLLREIEARLGPASNGDRALLEALRTFYLTSDIYRVAGEELKGQFRYPSVVENQIEGSVNFSAATP